MLQMQDTSDLKEAWNFGWFCAFWFARRHQLSSPTPTVNQCRKNATPTASQLNVIGRNADSANRCTAMMNPITGQSGTGTSIALTVEFIKWEEDLVETRQGSDV